MTKEEAITEIEELAFFLTLMETMEKHGYHCTYTKLEELSSFQEPPVHQKKLALMFAAPTVEKNTLFSISQELEKFRKNYTKFSKKSKMDWFLITGTEVVVEISKELK